MSKLAKHGIKKYILFSASPLGWLSDNQRKQNQELLNAEKFNKDFRTEVDAIDLSRSMTQYAAKKT